MTLSFEMMCVKGVCYYTWSDLSIVCSDQGLMLKISALKFFLVANLCYQLSLQYHIALLYSPTNAAPQFL